MKTNLLSKLARYGVVPRHDVKNNREDLLALIRQGFVRRVYMKRQVFYELKPAALPLMDFFRGQLVEEARLRTLLYPRRKLFYRALLGDLRFFDTARKEADDFLFLGDWRLMSKPNRSQLELSQYRYYEKIYGNRSSKGA